MSLPREAIASLPAVTAELDVLTLATKPMESAFSGVRLIRSAVAGRFAEHLRDEWTQYVADGKIKPDYANTDQARTILADILETLEQSNFDGEQLDLLRRLFLAAASETVTDRNDVLVREYMHVARSLATGEIRVLGAYYCYLPEWTLTQAQVVGLYGANDGLDVLRKHSGLTHTALIEHHERSLVEKRLIRDNSRGYAETDQKTYRLTDFGFALCEFLSSYERMSTR